MGHPRFSGEEIARRGQARYDQCIRPKVENEANIGKLVSIDVETGDYEIDDDDQIEGALRLHERHPGAVVYTLRIGYNAVDAVGGVLERTAR
jgi:hypothetical protein